MNRAVDVCVALACVLFWVLLGLCGLVALMVFSVWFLIWSA